MKKLIAFSDRHFNSGILVLRLGIGLMFIMHGLPKIQGGPETWHKIGQSMSYLGVGFGYTFWGFMAAFAETFGGLFLAAGLLFQPMCLIMLITMLVASIQHLAKGDGLMGASHAIESGIVFLSLFLTGAGKYSLDRKIFLNRRS